MPAGQGWRTSGAASAFTWPMIEVHLRKLRARDSISPEEEEAISRAARETRTIPAHRTIVRAWEPLNESLILLRGWVARAKDLQGGQRQITELNVPGDFVDLHGFTLKRLDHDLIAMTNCTLAVVPHDAIREITDRMPHFTRVYWFATNIDAAIHREWMLSAGRRSAIARVAHLFCELLVRLQIVGLADEGGYDFPLTQMQLADCLGLTSVHVNRTLQELRKRGLIELREKRLRILNLPVLKSVAEFDPSYLYVEKMQR